MKLKYEKPMVAVECYKLSQSISGCGMSMTMPVGGSQYCLMYEDGVPDAFRDAAWQGYFADSDCEIIPNEDHVFDGICYYTSAGGGVS